MFTLFACRFFLGDEIAREVGVFQFEQRGFPVESAAISDERTVCSDHPVARDDEGNGIVSDRAADRSGIIPG